MSTYLFLSLSLPHDEISDEVRANVNNLWEHFHCRQPVFFTVTNLQNEIK